MPQLNQNANMSLSSSLSPLLGCPHEIIDAILCELRPSLPSIAAVACVCRKPHPLATHVLYNWVMIWNAEQGELFSQTILKHPLRIYDVRKLEVHYNFEHTTYTTVQYGQLSNIKLTISWLIELGSLIIKTNSFTHSENPYYFDEHGFQNFGHVRHTPSYHDTNMIFITNLILHRYTRTTT